MSTATAQALANLAAASELLAAATAALSDPGLSAGHAACFGLLLETLGAGQSRAQIEAAHALRRTGAHKLDQPSLHAAAQAGADPTMDHFAAAEGRTTAGRTAFRSARSFMQDWLDIPRSTAHDRLIQADCLIGGVDESGAPTEPWLEDLAEDFADPALDPRLLAATALKLHSTRKDLPAGAAGAEQKQRLQSDARQLMHSEPKSARKHIATMVAQVKAGKRPLKALLDEVGLFRRGTRRGLIEYILRVLPSQAAAIEAHFASTGNPATQAGDRQGLQEAEGEFTGDPGEGWDDEATKPDWAREGNTDPPGPDPDLGAEPDADAQPDPEAGAEPDAAGTAGAAGEPAPAWEDLKPERRRLIGLMALLLKDHRANNAAESNRAGLATAQVSIILDYEKMLSGAPRYAVSSSGLGFSPGELRAAMCNAGIYPVILNGRSLPLDLGRTQRLFTKAQGRTIRAAYRGCAYPGCAMPVERCELDHLDAWEKGGCTDIHSASLCCPVHHVERHCGLFHAVKIPGCRPMVLLPPDLDPDQQLRINTYFMTPEEALAAEDLAQRMTAQWRAGQLDVDIVEP
ncbi:HNH endonuclease [Glutamicibacter sp. JL.03c]|uniref:HNH endonuclease signature motif containing protein n=1 Tax=Glutamicibacter sp. JL.03c TaxID=2984842 RepID=UPI0021F79970|nr:HNH endonuclease signature motif containing protein [Glutamicibacter sp. JL.03c]UYQ76813.1 HNH endonuclease [Glutamicibacter sp. JL.03c]